MDQSNSSETPGKELFPPLLDKLHRWILNLGMALLGLFLLMSPAGTSVGLVLVSLALLIRPSLVWRLGIWREPFVVVGLVFFLFIALHGIVIAQASGPAWAFPGKYGELWRAPILLAAFALCANSQVFWRALLLGSLSYAGLHCLNWFGVSLLPPEFFGARRISAGLGLLAVAWVSLGRSARANRPLLLWLVSVVLSLTVLFAIDGRTGHLLLVLLAALAGWFYAPRRWRWVCAVSWPLLVAVAALGSKAVQSRMSDTMSIVKPGGASSDLTSAGLRKQFYINGAELVRRSPWLGVGYSNIPTAFHAVVLERLVADPSLADYADHPYSSPPNLHNEYLMQWAGGGFLAFALWLVWLASPLFPRGHDPGIRVSMAGLVVAFSVGCLFNSWLLDFTEGHVYLVIMAWLLSHKYRRD